MKAYRTLLIGGLTATLLAACGGDGQREFSSSGGNGATATPTTSTGAPVAIVELSQSAPTVSSDGRQTVRFFATAKDTGNVAIPEQPVAFAATGTGVTLTVIQSKTGKQGQAAEAVLSVGDPTNRGIKVTATSAGLNSTADVAVIGTAVSVSGPASVATGAPATFQVRVKDASGAPVLGKTVTATSSAGNAVSVAPALTDSQGAVSLILTPAGSGSDTLTVTSAGATGQLSVQVSSTAIAFQAPPTSAEIVVNSAPQSVRVQVLDNNAPLVGATIGFTATRGTLGAATATTDSGGFASTTVQSSQTGRSLITATSPNGTVATRELFFLADRAARIEVQASPSTVGVNLAGSTSESSQINAVVRDLANNPVRGARVNFTASDPSAGAGLLQSFALTDGSGRATVNFYPGPLPTGANQIIVTGTIDCSYSVTGVQCAPAGTNTLFTDQTRLTASRRTLQVRIGTGNEAKKIDSVPAPVYNEMPYGVLVTDSAGNPVSGVTLNATVLGLDYGKGRWIPRPCSGTGSDPCWEQVVDAFCPSEDVNSNLLLDPGEDLNGDGVLTPGSVASAYFGTNGTATSAASDTEGSAVLRIRYLRDRSRWVNTRIRVTASVPDGTEGAETVTFLLPVLGSDLRDASVPPPGGVSPYGTGACP
jgi:hypothetical protein